MVTRGRQEEAEGDLKKREIFRGGGRKERESERGRKEEVKRGTRDGWVETKGMGENERCRYERLEEVQWEKIHVKLFVRFGNNIWLFHARMDLHPSSHSSLIISPFFTRAAAIGCSWLLKPKLKGSVEHLRETNLPRNKN